MDRVQGVLFLSVTQSATYHSKPDYDSQVFDLGFEFEYSDHWQCIAKLVEPVTRSAFLYFGVMDRAYFVIFVQMGHFRRFWFVSDEWRGGLLISAQK
jgi:hypothetical protein